MGQLQKIDKQLGELGFQVIAVSPDRPEKIKELMQKSKGEFTLLSDSNLEAARKFGLVYRVNDETFDMLKGFGIDIEDASGEKHHLLPVPALFVTDRSARIHFSYANPDYKSRVSPDVVLAAAKAIK
ncbi:MAG: redoxin domain-containing protein [bacterium]|nr:redoxin domain-containing protein [bacterium]